MANNDNIIYAKFNHGREITTDSRSQYAYGQVLKISGLHLPASFDADISNKGDKQAKAVIGTDNELPIDDAFFLSGKDVIVMINVHAADKDGRTKYIIRIPIEKRPERADIELEPVEQDVISVAIATLNEAVEQTSASAESAENSANRAHESAVNAETSATSASNSEVLAQQYMERAETAAENAEQSKTRAKTSEDNAKASEIHAEQIATEIEQYTERAETASTNAQSSASTATQKAIEASASASTASTKADEASTSATNAQNSANNAQQSATDAQESANSASASASKALVNAEKTQNDKEIVELAKSDVVSAVGEAQNYATTAQSASQAIQDMNVEAVTLGVDSDVTVEKSVNPMTGAVTLTYGIPKGVKGDKGDKGDQGIQGIQGERGIQGEQGERGEKGDTGSKGDKGDPFVYSDFTSEQLASLKGEKGDKGDKGDQGIQGEQGIQGIQGIKGDTGAKGDKGDAFTYSDFTPEQLASLKGEKGDTVIVDPIPTQGSTNAVSSGGVWDALTDVSDALSDSVDGIQSEVGYFTEYRPVLMSKGRINIGSSTTNLTPEDVDGYEYAIVACSQGDMFTINAQTESGIRVWGFVTADGTNVYKTNGSNAIESIIISPAGSEYLVINNTVKGNISYIGQRTSKHVDAMEKEVNYPIKMSQQTDANGKYYYINAEASTISFNSRYTIASPYSYAIVPCAEGDVFTINATGGGFPRAYAFASIDGTNLQKADSGAVLTDYEVTAPANSAFLIINDFSDRTSYKGTLANCPVKRNQLDGVQAEVSGALLDVSEIKTDLYNTPIAMIGTNQYINLGFTDLTQPVNLTRLYGMEGCKYAIVECQEGDKFILNAAGGSYPRAYAFIDSDNLILERAEQNASFSNAVITAPANTAKLVINDKSGATSYYGKKSLTYRVDTLESAGATPLRLKGKNMVNFGDSVFGRGQGDSGISGRLAYKTGATVYNCGLSGTAMAIRQSLPYYNPFAMCNLADAIASGNFSTQEAALSE